MKMVMDNINVPENGSPLETGVTPKRKRKLKKHCPVCGKRLYPDGSERWYCPRCQAEVDGERVSFNYVPEGEPATLLQTG